MTVDLAPGNAGRVVSGGISAGTNDMPEPVRWFLAWLAPEESSLEPGRLIPLRRTHTGQVVDRDDRAYEIRGTYRHPDRGLINAVVRSPHGSAGL